MKYILAAILFLVPLFIFSQVNQFELDLRSENSYITWKQEYNGGNGLPSFYWMVTRSHQMDAYGRFYYKIYFYSNSRYPNGTWAGTYLYGITIYVNNMPLNPNSKYWIMFKETYHNPYFGFWSSHPPYIALSWDNILIN
jgi:hypothetical protein